MNSIVNQLGVLLLVTLLVLPSEARALKRGRVHWVSQSQEIQLLIQRIDRGTRHFQHASYVEALCSQFNTPLSVVEELYSKGSSTGKITFMLAMAESLSRRDPVHFATTADALFQIQYLRSQGHSFNAIARLSRLRVNDVLQASRRSYSTIVQHSTRETAMR